METLGSTKVHISITMAPLSIYLSRTKHNKQAPPCGVYTPPVQQPASEFTAATGAANPHNTLLWGPKMMV